MSLISDTTISVPSFLSTSLNSGISTAALNCSNSCQSCEANPMSCGSGESTCNTCQGVSCEGTGQGSCSTTCQTNICQSSCESVCNTTCQGCNSSCQHSCQSCQSQCEIYVEAPDVDLWSWSASNGSATATQTSAAHTAVTSNGEVSNFSYLVWNDLVDKIYEAITADDGSWNTKFASYSATRMSSSDKTLTATRFNSARYNVGLHYSTGINDVSTGDTVLGEYFTTITSSLNSYISSFT